MDVGLLFSPRPDLPKIPEIKKGAKDKAQRLVKENKKDGVTLLLEPVSPEMRDVFEEKGVLRTKTWQPGDFDNLVIDTITDMKGVKPTRSYTYNYREIQKETDAAKQATDKMITAQNKPIDSDVLLESMQETIDEVLKDPITQAASGDIQQQLEVISRIALESVEAYGTDLVGVLEASRRLDEVVGNFDGNAKARNIAARKIRGVLNDTLKDNTRGDQLHNLLTKQFHGITAMEEMLPKRTGEARDAVSRAVRSLQSVDLLPNTVLALGATGTATLGAVGGAVPATAAGTAPPARPKAVVPVALRARTVLGRRSTDCRLRTVRLITSLDSALRLGSMSSIAVIPWNCLVNRLCSLSPRVLDFSVSLSTPRIFLAAIDLALGVPSKLLIRSSNLRRTSSTPTRSEPLVCTDSRTISDRSASCF